MALRKIFWHLLHAKFFHVYIIIKYMKKFFDSEWTESNAFISLNLKLICTCEFFRKLNIMLAEAAHAISDFWKTHECKLIPNWTQNRMVTCTNK